MQCRLLPACLTTFFANPKYQWLLVFFGATILYVATLSRHFTGGSIEFTIEIESGNWLFMLQRHKLLVHPMGWAFYQLWQFLGWNGKALLPLQVFNALAGALAVGLMFRICVFLIHSFRISLLITLGFAFSCAIWLYSTEAEFVTPPLAEMLIVLWWLVSASLSDVRRLAFAVKLGVGTSIAILTYATNAILVPIVIIGFMLTERETFKTRIYQCVRFLIVVASISVPVYMFVMYFVDGVRNLADLQQWRLYGGGGTGILYGRFELANIAYGGYAFLRTLASFPGLGMDNRSSLFLARGTSGERIAFVLFNVIVLIVVVTPIFIAWVKRSALMSYQRTLGILATWVVLQAAFSFYWVPKDLQFWVPILVSWWLLVGLGLRTLCPRQLSHGRSSWQAHVWTDRSVLMLVVLLMFINAFGLVLPHCLLETNENYWVAQSIKEHTSPEDLIIISNDSNYISYFSGRQTISMLNLSLELNSKPNVFAAVDNEIRRVQSRGGRTFLVNVQPGKNVYWDEIEAAGLKHEDFQYFKTVPGWSVLGEDILEIIP